MVVVLVVLYKVDASVVWMVMLWEKFLVAV